MNGQIKKYKGVEGYEGVVPVSIGIIHLDPNIGNYLSNTNCCLYPMTLAHY